MRNLFIIFASVFIYTAALAQPSYKQAKSLLEQSSQTMKSYASLKIAFNYNFENTRVEPPITQKQTGTIALSGDNYHLTLESLEQIRQGNKLYNILNEDEEVQITEYDPTEDEGLTPSKILDLFSKGYSYKMGGTETKNGQKITYVILKPNANPEIDKIMIGIEASTKHVHSMKQWGQNGTITTLTVTQFTPNPSLPSGYFKFNKANYPDYYIAQ